MIMAGIPPRAGGASAHGCGERVSPVTGLQRQEVRCHMKGRPLSCELAEPSLSLSLND